MLLIVTLLFSTLRLLSTLCILTTDDTGETKYLPMKKPVGIDDVVQRATEQGEPLPEKLKILLEKSVPLRFLIQLDATGFVPNRRQHTQFGLSVLQMTAGTK